MRRLNVWLLCATSMLGTLAVAGPANAQRRPARTPVEVAEPTPQEREYLAVVDLALIEYQGGRWAEANVLFARAHALFPNARTLRGMGMCAFEMRDYVTAIVAIDQSLVHEVRPLEPQQRVELERTLAQSLEFVGRLALVVEPADASITIDGIAPTMRDGVALVNPGSHDVRAESGDLPPEERRVRVDAGATVQMRIVLRPAPVATVVAPLPVRVRPHPVRLPSAIAYGAGGVGLGLFAGFGIRALVLDGKYEDGCLARGTCTDAQLDRVTRSTRVADVGLGLAIAGTATGLLLQLLHTERPADQAPVVSGSFDGATGMIVIGGAL